MKIIDQDELAYENDGSYTYEGEPFTGTARLYDEDGKILSEASYVNGMQHGIARYWFPSGELMSEENFVRNSSDGVSRVWYQNGKLKREMTIEHGICTRAKEWNENGDLIRDYVLPENDTMFEVLQLRRRSEKKD